MARDEYCDACLSPTNVRKLKGLDAWLCERCKRKQAEAKLKFRFLLSKRFRGLVAEAAKHNVRVQPVFNWHKDGKLCFSTRLFYADGRLCMFSILATPFMAKMAQYWKGKYESHHKTEFSVIRTGNGRRYGYQYLVVPAEMLELSKSLYIPLKGRTGYNNVRPKKIDLLQFEERWNLVKIPAEVRIEDTPTFHLSGGPA